MKYEILNRRREKKTFIFSIKQYTVYRKQE